MKSPLEFRDPERARRATQALLQMTEEEPVPDFWEAPLALVQGNTTVAA